MSNNQEISSLFDRLFPRRRPEPGELPAGEGLKPSPGSGNSPWIIVGLGNPGPQYEHTRHNVGLWCIEEMAKRCRVKLEKTDRRARTARAVIDSQDVVLVACRTFVNDSGITVKWAFERFDGRPEKLIVVLDEINLEVGDVRIRRKGSPGGHNGMKSIVHAIQTEEFARVRIGVGKPSSPERQIEHVLGEFSRNERMLVDQAVARAADAAESIVRDGIETAMNKFN